MIHTTPAPYNLLFSTYENFNPDYNTYYNCELAHPIPGFKKGDIVDSVTVTDTCLYVEHTMHHGEYSFTVDL